MEFLEKNRIEWINKINTFMCLFLKSQTVLEERMKTIENVIFFILLVLISLRLSVTRQNSVHLGFSFFLVIICNYLCFFFFLHGD